MSEARVQRDRRLIQRTAALLSEDYPLDQLIARLCDALTSELGAKWAFAALNGEEGEAANVVAVSGVPPTGIDLVREGTPAFDAYRSGAPVAAGAELYVPISYGDRTLGVLGLGNGTGGVFDEIDVRLCTAIARYLGIAVRNQRGTEDAMRREPEWMLHGIVAVVAIVLAAAVWIYADGRAQQLATAARDEASARLSTTAALLAQYVEDSSQLAATAVGLYAGAPHDRGRTESLLLQLLASAQSPTVYGVGVWYRPFAFEPGTRLYGPYANRKNGSVAITYQWMRPSYDYPSHPWYRKGVEANGATVYTDPYFDTDFVYVTAVRAFRGRDGSIQGVVTVDSILPTLAATFSPERYPGAVTYVASARGEAFVTSASRDLTAFVTARGLSTKNLVPIPANVFEAFLKSRLGDDVEVLSVPVPATTWSVRVAVARSQLLADSLRLREYAIGGIVAIVVLALLASAIVRRTRRSAERAMDLERQQHALTREIAERKRAEERLRERAYRDDLTRLPNRAFVISELARRLETVRSDDAGRFAVLFIDLDRFNVINDSLGHDVGDLFLAEIATRLRECVGPDRVLARLGGDEFVIVIEGAGEVEAAAIAEEVLAAVSHTVPVGGHELFVSASIGIALVDSRYAMPEEILRDADSAMYEAKRAGRATYRIFDQSMHARLLEALALESDLRAGLRRAEIRPVFQPIVSMADGRVVGFEALARWHHATRGLVDTATFVQVAEQTGLIVDVDAAVIEAACATATDWIAEFPDVYLSVNVSAAHLMRIEDVGVIRRALEVSGFPPSRLRIELTETAIMERVPKAAGIFRRLRDLGVGILVDDFGTGYSSLGYLQRLPLEGLKIDRSFVGEMVADEKAGEIVRAILGISNVLHLNVVAEGTETLAEVEALRAMGVEYAQGFYYSQGLEAREALSYLRESSKMVTGPAFTSSTSMSAPNSP